jgi:putative ABC transport system permease protein
MLRNYLKIAFRNIIRHKAFSIINISGLAIGMVSSILILLWVRGELSYDNFHKNAAQTYRLTSDFGDLKVAVNPAGMPAALKAKLPVIKNTVRLTTSDLSTVLLETGNKKFEEKNAAYADPSFLDIFSFPLLKGDRASALSRVDAVLITQAIATKYFGNEDPIGKTLRKDNGENVVVTGVLANIPANSHLQCDIIFPMASLARWNNDLQTNVWDSFNFYTYVQLDKNFDPSAANIEGLEKQIDQIFRENCRMKVTFQLQPLTKIHLTPEMAVDVPGHGNEQYVRIFFIVAILILIVACINFMNLATARSARRAKEIGLRKVLGAVRGHLIFQFLSESVLISFLSLFLALGIALLVLPMFNELAGKKLILDVHDAKLWISLFCIALLTGLISGSYPALFLSGFNPVNVLKDNRGYRRLRTSPERGTTLWAKFIKSMGGNVVFRNTLVVTQFMVSIVLLVGTMVIYSQLKFIRDRDPGFEKANLLYMATAGDIWNKEQSLKTGLKQNPLTTDFTIVSELPTNLTTGQTAIQWQGRDPNAQITIPTMDVDENFIRVFGMKLASGRGFSGSFAVDSNKCLVNETMARIMGLNASTAIGKTLTDGAITSTIIGVVKDFNFKPVQQAIEPLVLHINKWGGFLVIRTSPGNTQATIGALAKISRQLDPGYPFKFDFLDQQLSSLYKGDRQMGNIFSLFAILGIFISCLGLYGLSAFMAQQRTKEIGIRKVLGASLLQIVYLLSTGFTRLILIAVVIAIPLSWLAIHRWLESFAYHISINWSMFAIASLVVLLIAWVTVSYESIRAGIANPAKSLRTE